MTPQQYCRNICQQSGSNFVYTFWLFGRERREGLEAFYAFCREVDDAVDEASNTMAAQVALGHWRQEVEKIYQKSPQSPVGLALLPAVEQFQIPKKYLDEIITGCEMDLTKKSYANFAELEEYCFRVASCVGLVSLYIFGVELTAQTEQAGIALGKALQLTNILRDVVADEKMGRTYLPQKDVAGAIKRARNFYREAWQNFPKEKAERRKLVAAFVMGRMYEAILDKIEKEPTAIWHRKISLTKWGKIRIALTIWISTRF